ncbi:MAG: response regulator [Desulfobacterales bacterium]|nr:response regulator [Desulfobacterales bacterium]
MSGKHILVAEDEMNARLAMSIILTRAGYEVTLVEDGWRALESIVELEGSATPVDFLLTDWAMPGLTGAELLDELSSRDITLPTLVMTGYDDNKQIIEPLRKKSVECLIKPFEHETLINRISAVMDQQECGALKAA